MIINKIIEERKEEGIKNVRRDVKAALKVNNSGISLINGN